MQYQSLIDALLSAPPHREFITMYRDEDDVSTVRFGEFIERARAQAAQFVRNGVRPGDRVILIMPQGIPLMVSFAAAMFAGGVPAILAYPNFKLEPAKYRAGLAGVTKNLKAALLVVDEEFPPELLEHISVEGARLIRGRVANGATRREPTSDELVASAGQLAFIQHSAGTTGLQKGVALTHSCVL